MHGQPRHSRRGVRAGHTARVPAPGPVNPFCEQHVPSRHGNAQAFVRVGRGFGYAQVVTRSAIASASGANASSGHFWANRRQRSRTESALYYICIGKVRDAEGSPESKDSFRQRLPDQVKYRERDHYHDRAQQESLAQAARELIEGPLGLHPVTCSSRGHLLAFGSPSRPPTDDRQRWSSSPDGRWVSRPF